MALCTLAGIINKGVFMVTRTWKFIELNYLLNGCRKGMTQSTVPLLVRGLDARESTPGCGSVIGRQRMQATFTVASKKHLPNGQILNSKMGGVKFKHHIIISSKLMY